MPALSIIKNPHKLIHWGVLPALLMAASAGHAATAVSTPPKTLSELPLEVNALQMKLLDANNAVLLMKVTPQESKRVVASNKITPNSTVQGAAFTFNLSDSVIVFNDQGMDQDTRAGDGVFSGKLPINLTKIDELNKELSALTNKTIPTFAPRTRLVTGRTTLPNPAIDVTALRAGKVVTIPNLTVFGPVKALGAGTSAAINPKKSLLLTSIPIIEDPARTFNPCRNVASNNPLKVWTFGHLMQQMATNSGLPASTFVEDWLNTWLANATVMDSSGTVVLDELSNAASANMTNLIINPWRARSGGGALDLRLAPFRLNAIVYRPDLAISNPYGLPSSGNNGGELRFVFGMMNVRDSNNDGDALDAGDICQPLESAVIFEYGVPLQSCPTIKGWANEWVALSGLLPGSPAYNNKLQTLTQQVVLAGQAPSKPNKNALNQLRTNEIDLTGIWQFREFVITPGSGPLLQTTTKNQPREHQAVFTSTASTPMPIDLNGTNEFLNEVLANEADIISANYAVPELAAGLPFMGGGSSYNFNTFWDHPALVSASNLDARQKFSLNTCSGCHTAETDTVFYHIRPVGPGGVPTLSPFLQGPLTVSDPSNFRTGLASSHSFDEIANRTAALSHLANQSCGKFGPMIPMEVLRLPLFGSH